MFSIFWITHMLKISKLLFQLCWNPCESFSFSLGFLISTIIAVIKFCLFFKFSLLLTIRKLWSFEDIKNRYKLLALVKALSFWNCNVWILHLMNFACKCVCVCIFVCVIIYNSFFFLRTSIRTIPNLFNSVIHMCSIIIHHVFHTMYVY